MRTPLYEEHVALGARIVSFAGWDMPLLYNGIIPESLYTRDNCSVFDTCHMGVFDLAGRSASSDLDMLITQSVASLKEGACSYGYLLNEDGGVLDDLICFRRGPDSFRVVVNSGTRREDAAWIADRVSPGTSFEDVSGEIAKLDVQGPSSKLHVERALGLTLPKLGFFRFREMTIMDSPFMVSRTGYTGEFGYEFLFPAAGARGFWRLLLSGGEIRPAGLGARDVLRLEMGYPLYGHELCRERGPVAASGTRFIDTSKEFIGKSAVMSELRSGPDSVLVGLRMNGRQAARRHDAVVHDGERVGTITSGLFSPSVGSALALAYVAPEFSRPEQKLEALVRDRPLSAVVTDLPFYQA